MVPAVSDSSQTTSHSGAMVPDQASTFGSVHREESLVQQTVVRLSLHAALLSHFYDDTDLHCWILPALRLPAARHTAWPAHAQHASCSPS